MADFMTAQEIVTEYMLQGNFDQNLLTKEIEPSQRKYIKTALGKDMYDEIVTQVDAGTLTPDNTILMDMWIKRVLARYVVYEMLPRIRNNITSQGVMLNGTEFTESSSREDFGYVRGKVQSDGDFECKEMIDWLCDDDQSGLYPLFCKGKKRTGKTGIYTYGT